MGQVTLARTPASSARSPVAAAQQGHAICLCSEVTKRNICHQVAEMSCFHCSFAGCVGGERQTLSPETSPRGQLCFGGPQAHAKTQTQLPHFSAHTDPAPSLVPVFCLFSPIAAFCFGRFQFRGRTRGARAGPAPTLTGRHYWHKTPPLGARLSPCIHRHLPWAQLLQASPQEQLMDVPEPDPPADPSTPAAPQALQLRGYRHSHLSATPSRAPHGDTAVLLPAHPKCLPW